MKHNKHNLFLQKFGYTNKNQNLQITYKKSFNLINNLNTIKNNNNNNNNNNNKNISGTNSKTISISEVIKKIESLKNKFNQINLEKKINTKMTYNKLLNLKKKYLNHHNKRSNSGSNIFTFNTNKSNNLASLYKIESTDKITMINKSWNKNNNLLIQTNNDLNNNLYISRNNKKIKLQKSNEINYQINSDPDINFKVNKNKFNINNLRNYSQKNNYNIREEFLDLDKRINFLLKDDNDNNNDSEYSDEENLNKNNKKFNSISSIKERICMLTDVKKEIRKINKDSFEENEKTQNSSIDSQINLGFKHIKPIIKRENFYDDYIKDDEPKIENETISRPTLIKTFPRPKLNVPNFPSFFNK